MYTKKNIFQNKKSIEYVDIFHRCILHTFDSFFKLSENLQFDGTEDIEAFLVLLVNHPTCNFYPTICFRTNTTNSFVPPYFSLVLQFLTPSLDNVDTAAMSDRTGSQLR